MHIKKLLQEDDKKMKTMYSGYDPLSGEGAVLKRKKVVISDFGALSVQYLPIGMFKNKFISKLIKAKSIKDFIVKSKLEYNDETKEQIYKEFIRIRSHYDFCFWAYMYVRIKPKSGGDMIPFRLRHEQRKLLFELEEMRLSNKPIRIMLLKARQWGGSTLVQVYMAWIQLLHKSGWYSTIVAQTKDVSRKIKAMYSKLLESYPSWLLDIDNQQLEFSPYEGSASDFIITYGNGTNKSIARDTVVTIGTYENPDGTRGGDTALIHYSEVAMWNSTKGKKPEDLIRSISGGLLEVPLTVEVLESTANGTGNFFHKEWIRAKSKESNRKAVFIAWYDIEHDSIAFENKQGREEFAQWLFDNKDNTAPPIGYSDSGIYYWYLWQQGATLSGINWYRQKRKSFEDHGDMASEAPSNDIEAFKHSGRKVFSVYAIERLREKNIQPIKLCEIYSSNGNTNKQSLKNLKLTKDNKGLFKIWKDVDMSSISNRYVVVVDIGGRSDKADYSVICVLDRLPLMYGGKPEIVAQWKGHLDHDLLAYKSAQIACYYNNALLVIESNTLETKERDRDTEGDHSTTLFDAIAEIYDNLYARENSAEDIIAGKPKKWGFHTNVRTKPLVIDNLITNVRDDGWVERDSDACDELSYYERKENGSYGAISGHHDDILMTRAIGLLISKNLPIPKYIESRSYSKGGSNASGMAHI